MSIALANRVKTLEQVVAQLRAELDALGQRIPPAPVSRRPTLNVPKKNG